MAQDLFMWGDHMIISAAVSPIWKEYGLSETQCFEELKNCGFNYIDYDFSPANEGEWASPHESGWAERTRGFFEKSGIAPAVAHVAGYNPLYDEPSVHKAVLGAGMLGIKNVVIPLGYAQNNTRREYESANLSYLERLLGTAQDADVTLLIEHSGSWTKPHYTHHAIELNHIMRKLGDPERLKTNLNVAHIGVAEIKPYTDICLLGKSIRSVDLADNFGGMPLAVDPEREELGFAPMMGYIDYDRVMQGFVDTGYDGCFNLRMNMPRVFDKQSPYHSESPLRIMPIEFTRRLHVWSRHIIETMLDAYQLA